MTDSSTAHKCGLLSCMRNEAPFLLEWIAFHSLLGFERITVFTNDCTDGTDFMLDRLDELGFVTHIHNPMHDGLGPQESALHEAMTTDVLHGLDWVLHIDADEFLNVHSGAHGIADVIETAGDADVMALMWRPFGDSGQERWNGESILKTFQSTQARPRSPNAHHKSLFRPNRFKSAIDHMPKHPVAPDVVLVNSRGEACPNAALYHPVKSRFHLPVERLAWDNACINHYAIRSHDIFLMKNIRGDGMGRETTKYFLNSKFYRRQNKNSSRDASILRHETALDRVMAEFLSDPILEFLHNQAHRAFFRKRDRLLTPERVSEWTIQSVA